MTDEPGLVIEGRYRLDEVAGRGGMAVVYRATDLRLERTVAVKLFREDFAEAVDLNRIHREVKLLLTTSDPHIVGLLDASEPTGSGLKYLVMEYVDGTDLRQVLRTRRPSPEFARRIAADVATALETLHAQGVVHRDLKPENVLVPSGASRRPNGIAAKLGDFGIAQVVDGTRLTASSHILGTPAYLSPEQLTGARLRPGSDIYSLALVLIECLTGRTPFPGSLAESAAARLARGPDLPRNASPALAELLERMTALDPNERPQAKEVSAALHGPLVGHMTVPRAAALEPTTAVPAPPAALAVPSADDRRAARAPRPTVGPTTGHGTSAAVTSPVWPVLTSAAVAVQPRRRNRFRRMQGVLPIAATVVAGALGLAVAASLPAVSQPGGPTTPAAHGSTSSAATGSGSASQQQPSSPSASGGPSDPMKGSGARAGGARTGAGAVAKAGAGASRSTAPGGNSSTGAGIHPRTDTAIRQQTGATAPPSAPKAAPTLTSPRRAPVRPNSTITVSWPEYRTCPSGSTLTGYFATVRGAASNNGGELLPGDERSLQVKAGDEGSGPITVKYKVLCGQQASKYSPTRTVTVSPRLTPPSAEPERTAPSGSEVPEGSTITVSWPAYHRCPSDEQLEGYSVHASGAGSDNGDSDVEADKTSMHIQAGPAGSGPILVKYRVTCGDRSSEYSPQLNVRVRGRPPQPGRPERSDPSSDPEAANSTITVFWHEYDQCPPDEALSNYIVQVAGAASDNGQTTFGAGTTALQLQTGDAGSGPITVQYKATCGKRASDYSDQLTIEIAAETPIPDPNE